MSANRITVIVENTAGRGGLLGEHGLSFWIEWADSRILFDTGQGHVFAGNARQLGLPLADVSAIALSHGHYDHAGGLARVLKVAPRSPLYVHPAAFTAKFAQNSDGTSHDVGMPVAAQQAVDRLARVIRVESPTEIVNALHLTGPVPRTTDFEDTGGAFYKDSACSDPDLLPDDQAAFLDTPAGTVVILGCAHSGIINTLQYILKLTDNRPIHAVLGGMHLINASPERLDRTVAELRRLNIERLIPCHCTGLPATARLWNEFPGKCIPCRVGTIIELP